MKYRIWREVARREYKDVEAENEEEALGHHIDFSDDFTITDMGLIQKWWAEKLDYPSRLDFRTLQTR